MKNEKKFARPKAATEQPIENREQVRGYNVIRLLILLISSIPLSLK